MEGSQSSTGKTGVWQRIFDIFFGYDYFIAHRSVDGKPYAAALYGALTAEGNELDCFLDVKHYGAGGRLPWMQSQALNKTSRLIVISTEHAHDLDAHYLQGEIRQFRRYHPNGVIVSIGSRRTLSRQFFAKSALLPIIPNLDQEDIVILEEETDLLAGKVSPNTLAKLLNDFSEQRTSAKRLKWIKGIAVVMFLLALTAVGFWWRATNAQHAAEEQARIAESQRLAAQSASALTKYLQGAESGDGEGVPSHYHAREADLAGPKRSLLLAVEAVKVLQPLHGVRVVAAEQSLREAFGVIIRGGLTASADGPIRTLAISADSHWVVAGSSGKTARLWDLRAEAPAANPVVLAGHDGGVIAVAISADSRWVVTGSWDKTARLWDLRAKDPAANPVVLSGHDEGVRAVAISADSHWVVTGSNDKTARLWDLRAKDPAANPVVLPGHDGGVFAVAISADSRWLVTGSWDKTARLWDLRAKDPAANPVVLRGHDELVHAVAISADSHWVVTGSNDKTARLWDLRAKDPAANPVVLRGHDELVHAVAISANNRWVVTGSRDKTARLWDLRAKDPAANPVVLRGHDAEVFAVAISADSRWILTGSLDKTARLWDLAEKNPAANPVMLRGHDAEVAAVAISADNRWVVTGSDDSTVRLWHLQMNELVDLARAIVRRNFSSSEWQLYFPGEKYRKTFPELPGPD